MKLAADWKLALSILYVKELPVGAVIAIVPVDTVQVGCVIAIFAAVGVGGCAFITTSESVLTQPAALMAVT